MSNAEAGTKMSGRDEKASQGNEKILARVRAHTL